MVNKKNIVILLTVVLICGGIYIFKRNEPISIENGYEYMTEDSIEMKSSIVSNADIIEEKTEPIEYKVYVCGAVNNPQVVTAKNGDRIIDVIELAGGANENANLDSINLAAFIIDAQKIYVPKIGEDVDKIKFTAQNSSEDETILDSGLVDINKADKAQLQTLTGVGETIAQYIIEYREQNGNFKSIDDLKNVTRIGSKTFDKIKDKITVTD